MISIAFIYVNRLHRTDLHGTQYIFNFQQRQFFSSRPSSQNKHTFLIYSFFVWKFNWNEKFSFDWDFYQIKQYFWLRIYDYRWRFTSLCELSILSLAHILRVKEMDMYAWYHTIVSRRFLEKISTLWSVIFLIWKLLRVENVPKKLEMTRRKKKNHF